MANTLDVGLVVARTNDPLRNGKTICPAQNFIDINTRSGCVVLNDCCIQTPAGEVYAAVRWDYNPHDWNWVETRYLQLNDTLFSEVKS